MRFWICLLIVFVGQTPGWSAPPRSVESLRDPRAALLRTPVDVNLRYAHLEEAIEKALRAIPDSQSPRLLVASSLAKADGLAIPSYSCQNKSLAFVLDCLTCPQGLRWRLFDSFLAVDRPLPPASAQRLREDAARAIAAGEIDAWAAVLDRIAASGDLDAMAIALEGFTAGDRRLRGLTRSWLDYSWLCLAPVPPWGGQLDTLLCDPEITRRLAVLAKLAVEEEDRTFLQELLAGAKESRPRKLSTSPEALAKAKLTIAGEGEGDELEQALRLVTQHADASVLKLVQDRFERDRRSSHQIIRTTPNGQSVEVIDKTGPSKAALLEILSRLDPASVPEEDHRWITEFVVESIRSVSGLRDGQLSNWWHPSFEAGLKSLIAQRGELRLHSYDHLLTILATSEHSQAAELLHRAEPVGALNTNDGWGVFVESLAKHRSDRALNELASLATDKTKPELQIKAVRELIRVPCPQAFAVEKEILAAHRPGDPFWEQLVKSMHGSFYSRLGRPVLKQSLESTDAELRRAALMVADRWLGFYPNDKRVLANLDDIAEMASLWSAHLAREADPLKRIKAIPSGRDLSGGSAVATLLVERAQLKGLREDPDPRVRVSLAQRLLGGRSLVEDARKAVRDQMQGEPDAPAKETMNRLLAGETTDVEE